MQFCSLLTACALPSEDPATATAPAGRRHADAIFHPTIGEIVLVGGASARSAPTPTTFDDLWSWNGERWRRIDATGAAQMCGRLVFDATHDRLLLHGGTGMFPAAAARTSPFTTRAGIGSSFSVERRMQNRRRGSSMAASGRISLHDPERSCRLKRSPSTRADTVPSSSPGMRRRD